MRLTTKIVLGIISSIFLMSFCLVIYNSFFSKEDLNYEVPHISQLNFTHVDIEPYKTILIDKDVIQDSRSINFSGTFMLRPVINEDEKNKLFLPDELLQFTDIISSNDTLIIKLKMDDLYEKYYTLLRRGRSTYYLNGVNFFLHTSMVDVVCDVNKMDVGVQSIKTDKIKINTRGAIYIDSCQVNIIEPYMMDEWRTFTVKNSQVKELNIDRDNTRSRKFENCEIEVINFTGSKYSNSRSLFSSEIGSKTLNWIPKDEEAQLRVVLQNDTARIVFQ